MMPFAKDTTRPQRILALWFPYLPADRLRRSRLGASWRSRPVAALAPLVFSARENNTQRIVALDALAAALRLKPGLGVAEARALHPAIEIVQAEPAADRRLLEAVADWCDRYTPLVAIEGEDGLFLDITGCAHLFGGERAMMDDLLARLFHQGFETRTGLASTPGAAWASARFAAGECVEDGNEEDLLAPMPLAALRLEPRTREGLRAVGLHTVGAVMSTPRAPLVRRFGRDIVRRLDQALGRIQEAISPRLPVPPLMAERRLAEPVGLLDDIETLVFQLAGQLKIDLERRGEGAESLQLSLFRVDGAVRRIAVGTSRPLREPRLVQKLFHERLATMEGAIDAGYGFDLVRLSVLVAARLEAEQASLGGEGEGEAATVALFADRVRARLGEGAIRAVRLVESHLPERAAREEAFSGAPHPAEVRPRPRGGSRERPVRLLQRPECVDVTAAEVPEGPPMRFRWRRASYRIVRAEGPERIAPEWWRDEAETDSRDYFLVEDQDGRRFWLYRSGLYGGEQTPRWYLQGLFA